MNYNGMFKNFKKGESIFDKVTLMLLGPTKKIDLRHGIRKRLHKEYGYPHKNIIIMEDIKKNETRIISKLARYQMKIIDGCSLHCLKVIEILI